MNAVFLEKPREVSFGWHFNQVLNWLRFDNGRHMDNVLVYTSVELRCAIERFWFELVLILKDQNLTPEEEVRCRSKDGLLQLIKETEPYYVKRTRFTNLIASVNPRMPKVVIVDFKYLTRKWHELSEYCHKKLQPEESFESPNRKFQEKGFELVNDIVNRFKEWLNQAAFGIISKTSLALETKSIYEKYVNDELDDAQVKRMLNLAHPILSARRK